MKTTNKTNKTMWLSNEGNLLEIMYIGDNKLASRLIELFKLNAGAAAKVRIIKANYNDRTQLNCVYNVKETEKIGKKFPTLDAFISVVADMIGFEIAERSQCSDSATLINEEGFQLSAMLSEA